jgi:hypothetical protein
MNPRKTVRMGGTIKLIAEKGIALVDIETTKPASIQKTIPEEGSLILKKNNA